MRNMPKIRNFLLVLTGFLIIFTALTGCERKMTMQERKGVITMKGNPLTLTGAEVSVGQQAPAFTVVGNDLSPVSLSAYTGKVVVISSVPSLDTGVCDIQTRRFNEEAGKLGDEVAVLTISMDFATCSAVVRAAGVENVTTLSDYQTADFGSKYGLLIKELRLLARAVLVVDKSGVVRYVQVVPELTTEPDYSAAINAVKNAL